MPEIELPKKPDGTLDLPPEIEKLIPKDLKLSKEEREALLRMNIKSEYFELSRHLDVHHSFFYQMWKLGVPRLTFSIPTAAIAFDKKGHQVDFLFNPLFWKDCDLYKKLFVICHEFLHVLLNHGIRTKDCELKPLANIALDVVVNHMLVDRFGFDREKVKGWEDLCWLDTTFKDYDDVLPGKAFEYYYGILEQNCIVVEQEVYVKGGKGGKGAKVKGKTVDDHSTLEDQDDSGLHKEIKDTLDEGMNDEEKEDLAKKVSGEDADKAAKSTPSDGEEGGKFAGTAAGNLSHYANLHKKIIKKKKWETVIQKWSRRYKKGSRNVEQWARLNRRFAFIGGDMMLPSEHEDEKKEESMIDVFFFLDTSGSCAGLAERFFQAARTLPDDKFILHLFCFDTEVYDVDIKVGKLYGFGGTAFNIIEDRIQKMIKEGKMPRYPDAVFVMTDGYGNAVKPEKPKNWYWFLSEKYLNWIPPESNVFMLSDFE